MIMLMIRNIRRAMRLMIFKMITILIRMMIKSNNGNDDKIANISIVVVLVIMIILLYCL